MTFTNKRRSVIRKIKTAAALLIAALLTSTAHAQGPGPGPAPAAANNCVQLMPAAAASADLREVKLPGAYNGVAFVLVFADKDRARIGGDAQNVRSCAHPTQGHAIIYTVNVASSKFKVPLAGNAGAHIRIHAGRNAGVRNEFNAYLGSGKTSLTVLAAR